MRDPRSRATQSERKRHRTPPVQIEPGSAIATALQKAQAWGERGRNQGAKEWAAYETAIADFRAAQANVYPNAFLDAFDMLSFHIPADPTPLIAFLEADPYFFGSGYRKEEIIRLLKRCDLTPKQADRLRGVVLRSVERPEWRREDRHYGRLA